MAKVADALSWNKQVWDVFVEEAAAEDNRLPKELRAAIVSLGIWVTRETLSAIDSDGAIEALIAVNKDIMKGLRPSQSQAQAVSGGACRRTAASADGCGKLHRLRLIRLRCDDGRDDAGAGAGGQDA